MNLGSDFTAAGKFIIITLIQLGGLGIMSFTSIIFIIFGKRMSLSHERAMKNIIDSDSQEEIHNSLKLIFKYTFFLEMAGAGVLAYLFFPYSHDIYSAAKLAVFTSVSAFCNAGFFPDPASLYAYQHNPAVLYTVSFLFIAGGVSPAVGILLPKFLARRSLPAMPVIVLSSTALLLVCGTVLFFVSEYNGVLSGLDIWDKISNAWFQSATARTAGFSSVDLSGMHAGTFVMMVILMIIGGAPGGTAGGIKVCAASVLVVTCVNTVFGRDNIVRNRRFDINIINKSLTLVMAYLFMLAFMSAALFTTQTIEPYKLFFEAVSAMSTVGLSLNVTPNLDEVGKVIIILTMFFGRVFPATFICWINSRYENSKIIYPPAKISLT